MAEEPLARFVPRVLSEWDLETPGARWREFDATLCFVDISGFTNLSERLARRGRIGAEELTDVLDRVFSTMLDLAYDRGGSLLKFGGDALLLLFDGVDHAIQGASAAVEMRAALRTAVRIPTSVGRVALKMSVGVHSGPVHLFRVGSLHHELVITGPAASRTTEMESAAEAGQIMVSPETAARLPRGAADLAVGPGFLLRWRHARVGAIDPRARLTVRSETLERCVPTLLRDHLRGGQTEFEHRTATVGFLKFVGTDRLLAEQGADAVAAALDHLATVVQQVAEDERVTTLATDIDENGGKFILASGVPTSPGDDEGRMLRALRRVLDTDSVFYRKVGVHRGHVFAGIIGAEHRATFTVMGDTVNLAARLMSAAPPDVLYATAAVLDRSHSVFTATAIPPFMVKGKSQPVHAFAVGTFVATREPAERDELPFVGRVAEVAMLRSVLDGAEIQPGRPLLVVGPAGSGKSRLVREALATTQLDHVVVRGDATGMSAPYRSVRPMLRNLLELGDAEPAAMLERLTDVVRAADPTLLPLLSLLGDVTGIDVEAGPDVRAIEPRFRPARLADAVIRLLDRTLPAPSIVVVEDAQWVDAASADLLAAFGSVAADHGWQYVIVSRTATPAAIERGATTIELGPLPDSAQRDAIIGALDSLPLRPQEIDALVQRASGNPLFLSELVTFTRARGSVADIPESLDAAIAGEIDQLPPVSRTLLRCAAVLGTHFRPSVLRAVIAGVGIEFDDAALDRIDRFVEFARDDRAFFRNAVIRDAAYETLSYRRRRELHLRAGHVVERVAGVQATSEADVLAHHFLEGGDHARAWRYAVAAAEQARRSFANVEAAAHYRRALEAARRLDDVTPAAVADVWTALGDTLEQGGLFDAALEAYRRAGRLVVEPVESANLLLRRARARERAGSFSAALRELTMAERVLGDGSGDAAERRAIAVTTLRAIVREGQERPRPALELATRAARAARRLGESRELAKALAVVDWAHVALGAPERATNAPTIVEIYRELGEPERAAGALGNAGAVKFWLGEWNEALASYRAAEAAYARAGDIVNAAIQQANIGELLVCRRQYDAAATTLADAVRTLRAVGSIDAAMFAEIQLGRWLRGRGEHDRAEEILAGVRDEATALHLHTTALQATIHLGECLVDRGRAESALVALDAAEAAAGDEAAVLGASVALVRSLALASIGDVVRAEQVARIGIDDARSMRTLYELGLLLVVHADLVDVDSHRDAERAEGFALLGTLEVP
jgi:class 3 adenylate cyclase/tetratricopeptide (TPR) repeat protein